MFCTKCGAQALSGDMFCPECGAKLKHADAAGGFAQDAGRQTGRPEDYSAPQPQSWEPSGRTYESYSKPFTGSEKKTAGSSKKGSKSVAVIAVLLLLVAAAMLLFAGMRGYLGDTVSSLFASCSNSEQSGNDSSGAENDDVSDSDAGTAPSEEDAQSVTSTTTAAATTTTTTTTTKPTTTTTTVDAKKQEAEEIRSLLVSRTWKTQLEGYDATVKFKKDGTAVITVKVFLFSKNFDAEYSVSDKCHAVIQAEYEGQMLGISGNISKVSDKKLVVERDRNMGKVTLTAA